MRNPTTTSQASNKRAARDPDDYNDVVRHETLRAAVLDMCGDTAIVRSTPAPLRELMAELLPSFADYYRATCERECHHDGNAFCDPFGQNVGHFRFRELGTRLEQLLGAQRRVCGARARCRWLCGRDRWRGRRHPRCSAGCTGGGF